MADALLLAKLAKLVLVLDFRAKIKRNSVEAVELGQVRGKSGTQVVVGDDCVEIHVVLAHVVVNSLDCALLLADVLVFGQDPVVDERVSPCFLVAQADDAPEWKLKDAEQDWHSLYSTTTDNQ